MPSLRVAQSVYPPSDCNERGRAGYHIFCPRVCDALSPFLLAKLFLWKCVSSSGAHQFDELCNFRKRLIAFFLRLAYYISLILNLCISRSFYYSLQILFHPNFREFLYFAIFMYYLHVLRTSTFVFYNYKILKCLEAIKFDQGFI